MTSKSVRRALLPRLRWALLALVLVGCQVRTSVTVHVEDDGSGTVEVAVGLDAEALAELPDLDNNGARDVADLTQMVRVEDLVAAGWVVSPPEPGDDGLTWVRATKPFGTPEEAAAILSEITGANGALRDWQVARERSFGVTRYRTSGLADLSGGLEAFGDEGLAAVLDGEPLGEDAAAIEQELGQPLSEAVTLDVTVELPGGEATSWSPVLGGEPVEMATSSSVYDVPVLLLAGLAVVCGLGLVALFVVRTVRS